MDELISRRAAIDAIEFGIRYVKAFNKTTGEIKELFQKENDELREAVERVKELPSAQGDAEFISWLLDEIWDDEMWELNYRAFPELLCRRLVRLGYLKEEGGVYVRLDKQTGNQITVCPMCPDCPDNCPLEADMREESDNG